MTLIKLDSGVIVNTSFVTALDGEPEHGYHVCLDGHDGFSITPADRGRIIEAMGEEYTENKKRASEVLGEMAKMDRWY
ncbi:hypothetical protein [Lacticaseibacillus daqingensis]|uniref:hypothetical protein n=1 Tax=Lacticaseibacillus daqingensis TaxID=2486014 RepID=UPI000F7964C6|nr:hypothetical protein [Lacticaseibacillus daqingensis]